MTDEQDTPRVDADETPAAEERAAEEVDQTSTPDDALTPDDTGDAVEDDAEPVEPAQPEDAASDDEESDVEQSDVEESDDEESDEDSESVEQTGSDEDESEDQAESDGEGDSESDAPTRSKRGEALTNEGEIAADYLEELLDIADLDGDIDTFNEGGRAHVSIITDADVLVGRNGEVLEALQELARLAVMTETGHRSRLMLDIAGHREKRRAILQDLAADAVTEVNASGEPVRLAPMNPFERKIVHDAIAAAGLVSESEGEEPNRRVVVMPKG